MCSLEIDLGLAFIKIGRLNRKSHELDNVYYDRCITPSNNIADTLYMHEGKNVEQNQCPAVSFLVIMQLQFQLELLGFSSRAMRFVS